MKRAVAVTACALAAVVALASCAKDNAASPSQATSANPHSGHSFSAPPAQPLRAGEHFVNLTMPSAYTPKAPNGGTDEYRCFLIDPKLGDSASLTGSQFLPQNADIVHHAIFFKISADHAEEAKKLDADSPGEGWTCFGDSGVKGDTWVAAWAPGSNETLLDPSLGYAMPTGSLMVMQVHYNLLATGGKPGSSDQSSIRLRVSNTPGMKPLQTVTLPAPIELPCTSSESGPLCDRAAAAADIAQRFGGEVGGQENGLLKACGYTEPKPGPTQSCQRQVPQSFTIYGTAPHMHLLGRSMKIELNPGTPGAQTLLDVPNYNFDDQSTRLLPKPVTVKAGDTVRVTCTHDAGLRKLLPQLQGYQPRYVMWGDGTSDEMCLGLLVVGPAA
jgi:hypothetical protein